LSGHHHCLRRRKEQPLWPSIIRVRSLSSNSVAGTTSVPRLRNQDGIEKGISRLQLKLPTSISISAPIYSHRLYKRVCSYIGFPLSYTPTRARTHTRTHARARARVYSLSFSFSLSTSRSFISFSWSFRHSFLHPHHIFSKCASVRAHTCITYSHSDKHTHEYLRRCALVSTIHSVIHFRIYNFL